MALYLEVYLGSARWSDSPLVRQSIGPTDLESTE